MIASRSDPRVLRRTNPQSHCRLLRPADALLASVLCAVSIGLTSGTWSTTLHMIQGTQMRLFVLIGVLAVGWLTWVRRSRWRVCGVQHRWLGSLGAIAGALIVWAASTGSLAAQAGAILMVLSSLTLTLGTRSVQRFAPVLAMLVITVFLVRCQASLIDSVGQTNSFALKMVRLSPAVVLLAYLFAFATPFYSTIRFAIVLASPLAAAGTILTAPLLRWASHPLTGEWAGIHMLSNLLALSIVLGAVLLGHRKLRRSHVALGPFTLVRF